MIPATLPRTLSAAELESAVHRALDEHEHQIVVFDCDGTLWQQDSGSAFMRWSMSSGLLSAGATAWMQSRYDRYLAGHVDELAICGEMVQVYQGLREADLRDAVTGFFAADIAPGIFPAMRALVTSLRARGVDIWAVSSTNNWVVEEGVRHFNIPATRVLAASVEVVDGIVTDSLLDVPTDEGKVAALARAGVTSPAAVFGNSVHDAAMLSIARRAFPINPSPALIDRGALHGWPLFFPKLDH